MSVPWRCVIFLLLASSLGLSLAVAQSNEQEGPIPVQRVPVDRSASRPADNRKQPPRQAEDNALAAGESSSKQTEIDISPPKGDEKHPGAPESDVAEFTPWDPHRAAKCIEVGDFYFKQQNYKAAISRYEEALQWKPHDAEATYKLGEVLEKSGDFSGALTNYEAYLKILPSGPYADKARKGIDRVKPKLDSTSAQAAPQPS